MDTKKVVLVGDGNSGKSVLLNVFARGIFPEYQVTNWEDDVKKNVMYEGKMVELSLWDTQGQEDYAHIRPLSYIDTDVILMLYTILSRDSFDNIYEKVPPSPPALPKAMTLIYME